MKIERVFAMPNRWTFQIKPIRNLIKEELTGGKWLDPFVGKNDIQWNRIITNDINPSISADYHVTAEDFLKMFGDAEVDGVLFDPPYSYRQVKECYEGIGKHVTQQDTQSYFYSKVRLQIGRVVKAGGKAICCGWNSTGIGKHQGFKMERVLLINHGGHHNDTIVTVEKKMNDVL